MDSDLARALAKITTGIYVLTVADGTRHHGMSSSWVIQVSGEPPLIIAAIDHEHFSRPIVDRTRRFGLNLVGGSSKELEDYFLSARARRSDNLVDLAYSLSPVLKVPWLDLSPVSLEASVRATKVAGDHKLFIAEPVGVRISSEDRPLNSFDLDYVYLGGKAVFPRKR